MKIVTVNAVTQAFLVCHIRPASFSTGPLASESGRPPCPGGPNRILQLAVLPWVLAHPSLGWETTAPTAELSCLLSLHAQFRGAGGSSAGGGMDA